MKIRAAAALTLLVLGLFAGSHSSVNAASISLFVSQTCGVGLDTVGFSWQGADPSADQQWLDLTIFDNGWQPGTFIGAGPSSGATSSLTWPGLAPSTVHYVRLNQEVGGTWDSSDTFMFTTIPCAGGSQPANPTAPTLDLSRANELAHAALLAPSDFSGGNWTTDSDDDFDTADSIPAGPNCSNALTFVQHSMQGLVGHAERELSGSTIIPLQIVDIEVSIYQDARQAQSLLDEYDSVEKSPTFSACLAEINDLSAPAFENPSASVPRGGLASRFRFDFDGISLYQEHYVWLIGNAVINLDLVGDATGMTPSFVAEALQKAVATTNRVLQAN